MNEQEAGADRGSVDEKKDRVVHGRVELRDAGEREREHVPGGTRDSGFGSRIPDPGSRIPTEQQVQG